MTIATFADKRFVSIVIRAMMAFAKNVPTKSIIESADFKEVLADLGYQLKRVGTSYRASAVYRGGNSSNNLCVYEDGSFYDFVTGESGSLDKLIAITLNLKPDQAKEWLKNKHYQLAPQPYRSQIKMSKTYDESILVELSPLHTYWNDRGITNDTLRLFRGGFATKGLLKDRYVFPVFNNKKQIIGFTGRKVSDETKGPKYKHAGEKSTFVWPAFLNLSEIQKTKKVILVESPGCVLKMWEAGVKNVLCMFGTELHLAVLNFMLTIDPQKIIISTNNEPSLIGNEASKKIEKKLLKYFDRRQIMIALPPKKDFGECSVKEIQTFTKELNART